MIDVPSQFRPHIRVDYPENNKQIFEEWFYDHYTEIDGQERVYLPIFWTSFYVNNDYGNNLNARRQLQDFINSLDKRRKYFTIVQYDDGILDDISGLDIKVFGMGGGRIDYPLPLICMPHPYDYTNVSRDIFCFFQGSMTHEVRRKIKDLYKGREGFLIPSGTTDTKSFCLSLARSVFTLAPRGYGETSFRIMEALLYGSIPVYISDKHIVPHNATFSEYGILINNDNVHQIEEILRAVPPDEIRRKQEAGKEVFKKYFTYEANKNLIMQNVY